MKGLILADFSLYRQLYGKSLPFLILFFCSFGLVTPGFSSALSWLLPFYGIFLAQSELGCKWDLYTCGLPVSRRQMVSSRFLFILLLSVFGFLISLIGGIPAVLWKDLLISELFAACCSTFFMGLAFVGIALLCTYKFGVSHARVAIMIFCMLPLFIGLVFMKLPIVQQQIPSAAQWINGHTVLIFVCVLVLLCPLIFVLCWLASIRVRQKQEL